jgi:cytochrome b561
MGGEHAHVTTGQEKTMQQVTRYHPLLVTLHWLLAVLLIGMLAAGFLVVARMPAADPRKINLLMVHMSSGILILVLILIRLAVRFFTDKPERARTGSSLLDRLGRINHYLFYLVVIGIALSGMATALMAGLNRIVFQHSGEPVPEHFGMYAPFKMHALLNLLLLALIVLHVTAALWHQFLRRDGLFRRMGYGRRD